MTEIRFHYQPRPQFQPLHARHQRFAVMVCHRRAGKTVAAINDVVAKATYTTKKRAQYAYIAPFYRQAKDVAWEYLKEYARPAIVGKPRESELRLHLFNESSITLYGADNPDAFRGMYFDGVVIDEYGDMRPKLWSENVLPTLADRKGWALFMGTPKGPNHFRDMWDRAVAYPDQWFSLMLRASESGILDPTELAIQRAEMDPSEYEQEFECSFTAAVRGAVWADVLSEYEHLQRLDLPRDDELQVQIAMDIGSRDAAAAWVWQETPAGADMLFYHEKTGSDPTYWDQWFRKMGCGPEHVKRLWLPHDAVAKTFATQRTTVEQFLQFGYKVDAVPRLSKADGLQAARLMVPHTRFSAATSEGLAALYSYKYTWDSKNRVFSRDTEHTWASHGSDAFRYYALVAKRSGVKASAPRPKPAEVTQLKPVVWRLDDLWADYDKSRGSKGQILRIR